MWSIRQTDNGWEVIAADGSVFATQASYHEALAVIATQLQIVPAEGTDDNPEDGLLPEVWEDAGGIAFSQETGDGRDFSQCLWSARDPATMFVPLMLQTETEYGHFGAQLAGFAEAVEDLGQSTTPRASGRFYDSAVGRQFRDMLLGGRSFTVSVDPGHISAVWECLLEDENGWCIEDRITFLEYEIIGITGTPFAGFAEAAIRLRDGSEGSDEGAGEEEVAAAATATALSIPLRPPATWFHEPEPDLGDERLVEQRDGSFACPLTILDSGQFFGHLARWGQQHSGDTRYRPPQSAAAYAHWHTGEVVCEDGTRVATGTFTVGCDHALRGLRARDAVDHYAHAGLAWGDGRAVDGEFGPWVCGALRPDVTAEQLRVLRASTMSGDWRRVGGHLELIGILAVNQGAFAIARETLVASGLEQMPEVRTGGATEDGELVSLVASGLVTRCPDCQRRAVEDATRLNGHRRGRAAAAGGLTREAETMLRQINSTLGVIERRTRPLVSQAREQLAERIRA